MGLVWTWFDNTYTIPVITYIVIAVISPVILKQVRMRVITIGNIKAAASIVASAEALNFTLVLLGLERRYFIQVSEITVRTKQMETIDQFANSDSWTLFSIEISSFFVKIITVAKIFNYRY